MSRHADTPPAPVAAPAERASALLGRVEARVWAGGPVTRYGVALAAAATGVGVAVALQPVTDVLTYLPLFLSLMVAVMLAGAGPAIAAAVAGGVGTALLLDPVGEPAIDSRAELVRLAVYLAAALGVVAMGVILSAERCRAVTATARLEAVADGAPVGVALLDADLRFERINPMLAAMNGLPVEDHIGRPIAEVLPHFPDELTQILHRVLATGEPALDRPFSGEAPGGGLTHIVASWYPVRAAGRVAGVAVTVVDVTAQVDGQRALSESRAQLETAMRTAGMGAWELDLGSGRVTWSPALVALLGMEPGGFPGTLGAARETVHPDDRPLMDLARERARAGENVRTEFRARRADGTTIWIEDQAHVVAAADGRPERVVGLSHDVTARHEAEHEARRSAHEERLLAEVGATLDETLDLDERLARLARLLAPAVADVCVIDVYEAGAFRRAGRHTAEDELAPLLASLPEPRPGSPGARMAHAGEAVLIPRMSDELVQAAAHDADDLARRRALRLTSAIVVPLRARGHLVGILTLGASAVSGRELTRDDLDLARRIGERAAMSVDNALIMARERRISHILQLGLLGGAPPAVDGAELGAIYVPGTRSLEVGGDWYDAFRLPDGAVALVIGDVVGHGVEAAVAMGQLRGAVRALASTSPTELLARLDDLAETLPSAFATTLIYAVLDADTGMLSYACAGHLPPLVVPGDGGPPRLLWDGRSPPLACSFGRARVSGRERLRPGDSLLLYTDGLVERRTESLDSGLAALVAAAASAPAAPQAFVERLCRALVDEDGTDDVCALAVRLAVARTAFAHAFPARPGELSGMRARLRAWLAESGTRGGAAADVVLAVSEVASNAVQHAYRDGGGEVTVRARVAADGALELSVRDAGCWREEGHPAVRGGGQGWGLGIVRSLMDDVAVEGGETGTVVHMRRHARQP